MGWKNLKGFTTPQKSIFLCNKRFRIVIAGRRFGKTTLALNEALYQAQLGQEQVCWYIAPTYSMAKEIMWDMLKEAIPQGMIASKHETTLTIKLKGYNSTISLKGADNPNSLRGRALNFVVLDEFPFMNEEIWYNVIYPSLTDRRGKALFIGTPCGFNWAYDLTLYANKHSFNWHYFTYTTAQGGNVSPKELEYAKATMTEKRFNQEFKASFETLANRVYYAFDRGKNTDECVEDMGNEIMVGMDFNVDPMCAIIGNKVADQFHQFDEIVIENGNTFEMCEEISRRYPKRKIVVYPDPSGKARKTSAPVGQTDFKIIRDAGFELIAPSRAPLVVDRVNEVNSMFENANKVSRYFMHPRCVQSIKCLEGLTYKDKTSIPDKNLGLDHLPDAIGYLVHSEYPIQSRELKRKKLLGI